MTVQEFIDYFNNIYCDYDGAYGDQCFDLANGYSRWIGGPRFTGATADLIINQAGTFYTRIDNTANNFPIKGDIVVWNWPHVGIATGNKTDQNQFEALEQNDPTNSNCHLKEYTYNGVLGWLRPKQLPQGSIISQADLDQMRADRDSNYNHWQADEAVIKNLNSVINDKNTQIASLQTSNKQLTDDSAILQSRINSLTDQAKKVPDLEKQVTQQESARVAYLAENESLRRSIAQFKTPQTFRERLFYVLGVK